LALGPQELGQLLPYTLDRRASGLRRDVQSIIELMGDELLPRLREIRRDGPGRLRGNALEILINLGGADALDEIDRRAVERLVRINFWTNVRGWTPPPRPAAGWPSRRTGSTTP
jgi:hypothetical protein